jgi:7,8-dihydropterin-6-yl-methyl-4-(beta-D-ribofuranosyl)aminobenzene 5'-phosphate synthase
MTADQTPDGVLTLDALEMLVVVDNETDTLSRVDEGVPQIPEVAHLAARTPSSRRHDGHDCKTVLDQLCCACHGLSVLLTGCRGDQMRRMLFDVGPYPDLWLDNARRLAIDLSTIECIFLSHWHFDHSGGFPDVIAAIAKARRAAGLPAPVVDLHPDRPDQRGVLTAGGVMLMLPLEPAFADIEESGGQVVTNRDPHPICGGFFFGSGAIDRVTSYETGLVGHYSFRGEDGKPDPLIMDERFVAACVPGRGVTVLSACSHAGIVNACLAARTHFPNSAIDVVLGGYHLSGKAMEARIEPTIHDLQARIDPRLVAPGHCTGWRAKAKLAHTFAPGRYAPSVVGTLYRLAAVRA